MVFVRIYWLFLIPKIGKLLKLFRVLYILLGRNIVESDSRHRIKTKRTQREGEMKTFAHICSIKQLLIFNLSNNLLFPCTESKDSIKNRWQKSLHLYD